jgi:hypothetical protein
MGNLIRMMKVSVDEDPNFGIILAESCIYIYIVINFIEYKHMYCMIADGLLLHDIDRDIYNYYYMHVYYD